MDRKTINKACELFKRVLELNEKAPPNIYYRFEFSGHTKQLDFDVRGLPGCEELERIYTYLDAPTLHISLDDIEMIIAAAEKRQAEELKNASIPD